jgi:hypothetical protein
MCSPKIWKLPVWGLGTREKGKGERGTRGTRGQGGQGRIYPIPNAQCPMPHAQFFRTEDILSEQLIATYQEI